MVDGLASAPCRFHLDASAQYVALVKHTLALETGLTAQRPIVLMKTERAALARARRVGVNRKHDGGLLFRDFGVARENHGGRARTTPGPSESSGGGPRS